MIASILTKLTGGPSLDKARAEVDAATKAHEAAREAFVADASSRRWTEVQGAEQRLAQARLLLDAAERRAADQRAAEESARRANLANEAKILGDQLTRESLLSDLETSKTRLIAALIEVSAVYAEMRQHQVKTREKYGRLRQLCEELGKTPPDLRVRIETINHDISAQAATAAWDQRDKTQPAHVQSHLMSLCNLIRGIE